MDRGDDKNILRGLIPTFTASLNLDHTSASPAGFTRVVANTTASSDNIVAPRTEDVIPLINLSYLLPTYISLHQWG